MSKKTREQKREEERRMIAEMEAAMASNDSSATEQTNTEPKKKKPEKTDYGVGAPEQIHCSRCRTLMENGVCPTCGHRIYVPMDKKKQDKIRIVAAVVCVVAFIIIYVVTQFLSK